MNFVFVLCIIVLGIAAAGHIRYKRWEHRLQRDMARYGKKKFKAR